MADMSRVYPAKALGSVMQARVWVQTYRNNRLQLVPAGQTRVLRKAMMGVAQRLSRLRLRTVRSSVASKMSNVKRRRRLID